MAKKQRLIGLVGGTGFIGRATSEALRRRGCRVRLIARHQPKQLQDGEEFTAADTVCPPSISAALTGCDCVVQLVAVLAERGATFEETIHHASRNVAQAARLAEVEHMVYISALGADTRSASAYARAKGNAEAAVREVYPQACVIRPSLVIGSGGGFVRQLDLLTRYAPFMVLPGYGASRFQPIDIHVLADMIADACLATSPTAVTIEAGGDEIMTFRQIVVRELGRMNRRRLLVPLPWALTRMVAVLMTLADRLTCYRVIPDWVLVTPDQVKLLRKDNIKTGGGGGI